MRERFKTPLIYVTRDIERALGIPVATPDYCIISNATAFAKEQAAGKNNVFLTQSKKLLDTHELLENPDARGYINRQKQPQILVFKNTRLIENICKKNNWPLCNPSAELSARVEEKISQVEWLGDAAALLPPHSIERCKNVAWEKTPFILQFNRAHTGSGTFGIFGKRWLTPLQNKFPERPVRVTQYIGGIMLTNNNIVTRDGVLSGNINYQITGVSPFTEHAFATVGNDWALSHALLTPGQKKQYASIARTVGEKLRADGWKGLFGIDVMLEQPSGRLFLIEINARQPASAVYESKLQSDRQTVRPSDRQTVTTFEAHLMAALEYDLSKYRLIKIDDGAQIIVRNPLKKPAFSDKKVAAWKEKLTDKGFTCIEYPNEKSGADRLRIQSDRGIMQSPFVFNKNGKKILACLK